MANKSKRISGIPLLINGKNCSALRRIELSNHELIEGWLQKIIADHPATLPIRDIEPIFYPALSLGREIRTDSGPIDNMFISPTGHLTIVETKLWKNPEARREVVGQIMDYAKEVNKWTFDRLDEVARKHTPSRTGVLQLLRDQSDDEDFDEKYMVDNIIRNMRLGRILLLIVGDGIREGVEELTEYLQQYPHLQFTLALVELQIFKTNDDESSKFIFPQVVARTKEIPRGTLTIMVSDGTLADVTASNTTDTGTDALISAKTRTTITEKDFFEQLQENTDADTVGLTKTLMSELQSDYTYIHWGGGSFSIRFYDDVNPDADLSILNVKKNGTFNLGLSAAKLKSLELPVELAENFAKQMGSLLRQEINRSKPHLFAKDVSLKILAPVMDEVKKIIELYVQELINALGKFRSIEGTH